MWDTIWALVFLFAYFGDMGHGITIVRDADDTMLSIPDPDECRSTVRGTLINKVCKCNSYQPTLMSHDNGSPQCMNSADLRCFMEADQYRELVLVVPNMFKLIRPLDIPSYKAQCVLKDTKITAIHFWNLRENGQTGVWELLPGHLSKYFLLEYIGKYQLVLKINDDVPTHDWTGISIRLQFKCNNVDIRCMMIKVKGKSTYPVDINAMLREPVNLGLSSTVSSKFSTIPASLSSGPTMLISASLASSFVVASTPPSTAFAATPIQSSITPSVQPVSTLINTFTTATSVSSGCSVSQSFTFSIDRASLMAVSTSPASVSVSVTPSRVTTPGAAHRSSNRSSNSVATIAAIIACLLLILTAVAFAYIFRRRLKIFFAHAKKSVLACAVRNKNSHLSDHLYAGLDFDKSSVERRVTLSAIPLVLRNELHSDPSPSDSFKLPSALVGTKFLTLGPPVPDGLERPRLYSTIQRKAVSLVEHGSLEQRFSALQPSIVSSYSAAESEQRLSDTYTLPVEIEPPENPYEGLDIYDGTSKELERSLSDELSGGIENSAFDVADSFYLRLVCASNPTYTSFACGDSELYLLPQAESGLASPSSEVGTEQVYCELDAI